MTERQVEMLRHHAAHAHCLEVRAHCVEMMAEVEQADEPASDAKAAFPAILIVIVCALLGLALIGFAVFALLKGWF